MFSAGITDMLLVAVYPPSDVLTVITAVPKDFAVTRPDDDTVATLLFDELQKSVVSVALVGVTKAMSCFVSFILRVALAGETATPVTWII